MKNAAGAFPFTKTHCTGERPTRSEVCTSSPLCVLRHCWTNLLSILQANTDTCAFKGRQGYARNGGWVNHGMGNTS